jgi:O-antigen ligase
MALFYQGNVWVRQGYNTLVSRVEAATTVVTETVELAPADNEAAPAQTPSTEISNRNLSDFGNFNGRTAIWSATLKGLAENPSLLFTGTTPLNAGQTMTPYFPKDAPQGNFHNSFVAALVSFGLPGLLLILAFIVYLFVRSLRLIARSRFDERLLPARLLTSILVFTLGESMMEQFLFVDGMPSVVWVWFLLAAGFTFYFSREALQPPAA